MWYDDLFLKLEKMGDKDQAEKMSAYMQHKFLFLGVPKPELKEFMKPYLKESKKLPIEWDFIMTCWEKPYREAHYFAVEYVLLHQKELLAEDLPKLKELIIHQSWWDTVDSLDAAIGTIVQKNPALKQDMLDWSVADNLWLKRVAIDFQQEYKLDTDSDLMEKIICNNMDSKEFFIQKAIGWSLRDYSKVNPDWVRSFLAKYEAKLAPLCKKEAGKYL